MKTIFELASKKMQARGSGAALAAAALLVAVPARAQGVPAAADRPALSGAPAYVGPAWASALRAPLPNGAPPSAAAAVVPATTTVSTETIYNQGGTPPAVNQFELDADPTGGGLTFLPGGRVLTKSNAFFQSLGSNGRTCATCHQPPSGMSVSISNINARYTATNGADPIFAPVDGSTCPLNVTGPGQPTSAFSLLLTRGLFRVFLPVPAGAQFKITVLSDPYGCNTNPQFDSVTNPTTGAVTQMISVYRRPLITANLPFVSTTIPFPPATAAASPAIMWDERETSLSQQANDATLIHAQALVAPTAAQVSQMVQFELGVFSAQRNDAVASALNVGGATGGPVALQQIAPGQDAPGAAITAYNAWSGLKGSTIANQRASIARGEVIFNTRPFTVSKVGGVGTLANATCSTCHRQLGAANDPFGQGFAFDDGVGGGTPAFGGPPVSTSLPIFQVTCTGGASTEYNGSTVTTNDPGRALITGQCTDIEKFKAPPLRALASRAPYFGDGSAATLGNVVTFYNTRFSIGLSAQDQADLVNFLAVL